MWQIDVDLQANRLLIRSGRFIFPEHGWHDDVPERLVALAVAVGLCITRSGKASGERVLFKGGRYCIDIDCRIGGVTDSLQFAYCDAPDAGLLYQETLCADVVVSELRRVLNDVLNVSVQRRWGTTTAAVSSALADLPR